MDADTSLRPAARQSVSDRFEAFLVKTGLFRLLAHLLACCLRLRRAWWLPLAREAAKHAACLLLLPLSMVYLTQAITMQSFGAAWSWVFAHGAAVAAQCLLLAAAQLLLRVLLGGYAASTLLLSVLLSLLALTDYYKATINGFHLMLSDLTMIRGIRDIVTYAAPQLTVSGVTAACLVLFVLLVLFAWKPLRTRRPRKRFSRSSLVLLAVSALTLALCFGPGPFRSRAAALAQSFPAQEQRVEEGGVLYGLYAAFAASESTDYSSYNAANLNSLQNELFTAKQEENDNVQDGVQPHIIMILSESFFDVTRLDGIDFAQDPLPNFHALAQTSTNGRFLSSTYAGGTGNVEMETLTGFSNDLLKESDSLTSLENSVYAAFPSLARDAQADGYETFFIHSHNSTLYNRAVTMPALGFEHVVFSDDFETPVSFNGSYVSDQTLTNEIIHRFETRDTDGSVFIQAVSMENHQPYTAEKYAYSSGLSYTCDRLSDDEREVLDALITGLNHADAALGELVEYFENCGEPVMIVFYGDHLPSMLLGDNATLYSALGTVPTVETAQWTADELKEMLSTDYLIWTNYEDTPEADHDESSLLIGTDVLARAGLRRSPYLRWLSDRVSPVYQLSRPRLFVSADGSAYSEVPESAATILNKHTLLQYDLIYGEQRLAKYFRINDTE